jgi:hypothetical protein
MPQTANPGLGAWLMNAKEAAFFTIYIPILHKKGESAHFSLYFGRREPGGNLAAMEQKHAADGDLKGRLAVSIEPKQGSEPTKYVWRLDERMPDAFWVREILIELESRHRGELKEFLARCLGDAMRDPGKPFRAVFSTSAEA